MRKINKKDGREEGGKEKDEEDDEEESGEEKGVEEEIREAYEEKLQKDDALTPQNDEQGPLYSDEPVVVKIFDPNKKGASAPFLF